MDLAAIWFCDILAGLWDNRKKKIAELPCTRQSIQQEAAVKYVIA